MSGLPCSLPGVGVDLMIIMTRRIVIKIHQDVDNVDNDNKPGSLWKKNITNKNNSWGKTERLRGFVNLGGLWGIRAKCDSKLKTAAGPQVRPPYSRKVILGGFNQKIVPSGELIFGRHDDLIIMDFPV